MGALIYMLNNFHNFRDSYLGLIKNNESPNNKKLTNSAFLSFLYMSFCPNSLLKSYHLRVNLLIM